jgi:UDP-N-acetylglucosamine transferase subunit ALG13
MRCVVVSVGTDHHQFDRLMGWIEQWAADAPSDVQIVVQYGSSRPPRNVTGHALLPKDEFARLLAGADAIVVQGGPGVIMDARRVGRIPIAVPRLARYDEVVDDHQVTFCRQMREAGHVVMAESFAELSAALDSQLADPASARRRYDTDHVATTVGRIGRLLDDLLGEREGGRTPDLRRHRRRTLRRFVGGQRSDSSRS